MSTVVNLHSFGSPRFLPPDVARIDRATKYGNPFKIGNGDCSRPDCGPGSHPPATRESVIAAYRQWLLGMLRVEPDFLEPLRGKRLACWCAPLPCHGDVIAEVLAESESCPVCDRTGDHDMYAHAAAEVTG